MISGDQLEFHHGPDKVVSACRAYEGVTNVIANSSLLRKIYNLGSASLTMAEVRRTCVPSDDLDIQMHLRDYIDTAMDDDGQPVLYFESVSTIRENLAEVGIAKPFVDYEVDQEIRLYVPNVTLTLIKDRVRASSGKLMVKRNTVELGASFGRD